MKKIVKSISMLFLSASLLIMNHPLVYANGNTSTQVKYQAYKQSITLYERVNVYNHPTDKEKPINVLGPQKVKSIQKSGDWIQIQTWIGPKWIKPTKFMVGESVLVNQKLKLNTKNVLYNYPNDKQKTNKSIAPQTVTSTEENNEWFKINTNIGAKWIKSANFTVATESLVLKEKTNIYNKNQLGQKTTSVLTPQTVKVLGTNGEWKYIQTKNGKKWIFPIEGIVNNKIDKVYASQSINLYELPANNMKQSVTVSNQNLNVIEKLIKNNGEVWYQVKTWQENLWVKGSEVKETYTIELSKFGIYNDGTHPIETTLGINNALIWASQNGYHSVYVPKGTYLISKGDESNNPNAKQINLVSNMTVQLDKAAIFQKETNGLEEYQVIYVSSGVVNTNITGGTLLGDRDTHDYSANTDGGTHEWGYGVNIAGGRNIAVQGMNIEKFTGDGITIGGSTVEGSYYIKENDLELGGIDSSGQLINQNGKIRTKVFKDFNQIKDPNHRIVNIWLADGLSAKEFDVFYYDQNGKFLSKDFGRVYSNYSIAPKNAYSYKIVFNAPTNKGVTMNMMGIEVANNIIIKDNDIGNNRRQGITAGGEYIQILNNKIHDTHGTPPQAGIDIEPGYFPARFQLIKGNTFSNNKIQTVLAYGQDATIENNHFITDNNVVHGGVGLSISSAYMRVNIKHNTYEGKGLVVHNTGTVIDGDTFINTDATMDGNDYTFKNGTLINGNLSVGYVGSGTVQDTTIKSVGTDYNAHHGSLSLWATNPVKVKNVTMIGLPNNFVSFGGYGNKNNVIDHLKVVNGNTSTTGFPSGNYVNGQFSYTGSKTSEYAIHYKDINISNSTFKNITVMAYAATADATIQNSTFTYDGDINTPAYFAMQQNNVRLLNNTFYVQHLTNTANPIIKMGRFAWSNDKAIVLGGTINGNKIYTNLAVKGIHTLEAGYDSKPFIVTNNTLYNAKLALKTTDINQNNVEK